MKRPLEEVNVKPFTQLFHEKVVTGEISRPKTAEDYAAMLIEHGYIVVPLLKKEEVNMKNAEFIETLQTMPEFLNPPGKFQGEVHYVKGGFGSLGNPSSFHNPFVRSVRQLAHHRLAKPIFRKVKELLGKEAPENLEQIVDRMRVLRPKAQVGQETWHRDTTPKKYTHEGDLIYGGWISFDTIGSTPQRFSAFDRSHLMSPLDQSKSRKGEGERKEGFEKVSSEESEELTKLKEQNLQQNEGKNWFVEVPPGHMLIFQQEILHEVVADTRKNKPQSYRLFTAFRLTNSRDQFVSNQFGPTLETPLIKSGQKADMWPQANWRPIAWPNLVLWSEVTFKPFFLENRSIKSGDKIGEVKHVIPRNMYGMNDVSIKLQAANLRQNFEEQGFEIPEIYTDILENPPNIWRERWSKEELEENFIDGDDVFYQPYTQMDKEILRPEPIK